jgi:hypothetical protein
MCTIPHLGGWAEYFPAFLSAAKTKKVEHFVKVSFLRITDEYKGVTEIAQTYRDNVPVSDFEASLPLLVQTFPNSHTPRFVTHTVCQLSRYLR